MNKRTQAASLLLAAALAFSSAAVPARATTLNGQDSGSVSPAAEPVEAAKPPTLTIGAVTGTKADPNQIIIVAHENLSGRQVTLQVASGDLWTDVATRTFDSNPGSSVEFTRKYLEAGTRSYRAVTADSGQAAVSDILNVTVAPFAAPPEVRVSDTGNTVNITVSNGKGAEVRLYRTDGGRKLMWSSPAPATAAAFTLQVPAAVAKDGPMTVEAVTYRDGKETSSVSHSFTARAPVKLGLTTPANPSAQQKVFTITGDLEPGTQVSIQRNSGSGWAPVWTSKPLVAGVRNPAPVYRFPSEAIAQFRAVQTSAGKTVAATAPMSVTYEQPGTTLRSDVSAGLFHNAGGRIAANNTVSQMYFLDRSLSDRTGYLQEYTGGRWVNLQKLTFPKAAGNGRGVKVSTPVTAATVTRKYRVYVPATATKRDWASNTAVIEHMNPLHYTGYKRIAYDYMKGYCPNQTIVLIDGWISYANSRTHLIQLSTNLGTGKTLQYISLHECAHIRQFKLYKNDGSFQPRMNAIFGGTDRTGIERAADCMAYAMGADAMYGGSYTRSCSAAQMAAARKMLAGGKP